MGSTAILICLVSLLTISLAASVDPKVYEDLLTKGTVNIILNFRGPQTKEIVETHTNNNLTPIGRSLQPGSLPRVLEANSKRCQAKTLSLLQAKRLLKSAGADADYTTQGRKSAQKPHRHKPPIGGVGTRARNAMQYTQLWAFNKIAVKNADAGLIADLKTIDEVDSIELDREYRLLETVPSKPQASSRSTSSPISHNSPTWGVSDIKAPEAWMQGYSGQGVVVGLIDTGIRASHDILKSRYRLDFGWFDAVNERQDPYDDHGHGTHCAGTVAGTDGYGVAPNATLIACKGLGSNGTAADSELLTCGQFMLCPTDPTGTEKDCSKAPKIISNSWNTDAGNSVYNQVIDAWIGNNQIVVFSTGNKGPGCGTTLSPAGYQPVIAVGALTPESKVAVFSSRGPVTATGIMKPDVSAPGVEIMSASHEADNRYAFMSGTSMAAPHVSGAAAIYCSKDPNLNQQQVLMKLQTGAVATIGSESDAACGNVAVSSYPNNQVGHGKIQIPAGLLSSRLKFWS